MRSCIDFAKYGIFEERGAYYKLNGPMQIALTNFTITPCHMIEVGGKRLLHCVIKNTDGDTTGVSFEQTEIACLDQFRKCVEGYGNFLFMGSKKDYSRLRGWLMDEREKVSDFGHYGLVSKGEDAVETVRKSLLDGDIREIKWDKQFCTFAVRYGRNGCAFRIYRLTHQDAIDAMRQIPIVPFGFLAKEYATSRKGGRL